MQRRKIDPGDLFPKAETLPIACSIAVVGADTSGTPNFDDRYGRLWKQLKPGQNAKHILKTIGASSCYIARPDRPSPTLPKMQTGHGFATIAHWSEERALSIGEAKRIGSFPDQVKFFGEYSQQWARIGNSVPPLFMRAIARQIKKVMFDGERPDMANGALRKIDYLPFLESCWQEHLAPRADDAPTVISTFAGCGGSSLGYSMAGFRELLAIEWDDNAVETFKLNFPDVPVYHGDIAKISVDQVLEMTGLKVGELDVFDGSPPCQGFSTAGKREMSDDRNQLFREYVRLLRGLKPKVFVMENVSGMVKGKMKIIFAEIMRELKASGYRVSARLLNAMYFGVPQSRERMIFIGVREDLEIEPSHPGAETVPVTVGDAWTGCDDRNGKPLSKYVTPIWEKTPPGQSLEIGAALVLGKDRYFTHRKLAYNQAANTIQKSIGSLIYHPTELRGISLGELKRIASYPDGFRFTDAHHGWMRIGNSVPPLFMRSIARHIRAEILEKL